MKIFYTLIKKEYYSDKYAYEDLTMYENLLYMLILTGSFGGIINFIIRNQPVVK